ARAVMRLCGKVFPERPSFAQTMFQGAKHMSRKNRVRVWWCAAASGAVLAASVAAAPSARAQDAGTELRASESRLVDLRTAPAIAAVPQPAGLVTNRPTMPMADYVAAKNAAAARQAPERTRPNAAAPPSTSGVTLFTQVAAADEVQTANGHRFPPDSDIATSKDWMVQVVNDLVTMYNWNDNTFKQVNLNTFFASLPLNLSLFIFAPRVIHDPYWDRFVVVAAACDPCSGSSTDSRLVIAVSLTGDPSGQWVEATTLSVVLAGDFIDFPQLGMDLDTIIVTYNRFVDGVFSESRLETY